MSDAVKKPIGDKIDDLLKQVKFVVALLFAVFLLSLFARGHFNSGGRGDAPMTTVELADQFKDNTVCAVGEPGCDAAGLEVVEIPPQGGSWCPAGPDSCVEFMVEGGENVDG